MMLKNLLMLVTINIPLMGFSSENIKIVESTTWSDNEKEYQITIKTLNTGDFFTSAWKSKINASKCQISDNNECLTIWEINDFNSAPYEFVKYELNSFNLQDFNNDGQLDSVFFYRIAKDGNDPDQIKAMFHILDKKYAIRGTLPLLTDYASEYSYKFDDAFNALDRNTIIKCKEIWDNHINKIIFEGDL